MSRHVDGNAIGALLHEVFGREMTGEAGCCGHCGAVNSFGALIVYRDAPGDVVRCPACGTVLLVVVARPSGLRLGIASLIWIDLDSGRDA